MGVGPNQNILQAQAYRYPSPHRQISGSLSGRRRLETITMRAEFGQVLPSLCHNSLLGIVRSIRLLAQSLGPVLGAVERSENVDGRL